MKNKSIILHNILLEIIAKKKKNLISNKNKISLGELQRRIRNSVFGENLFKKSILQAKDIAFIAEIKFASPVNPNLGSQDKLLDLAKKYENAGVDAISIITEKHFFKGDPDFVSKVRLQVNSPVLQKDFIIDAYQIYEAKTIGSEALLLIARLLNQKTLISFVSLCRNLDIEPVVEINSIEDLEKAVNSGTSIIAVNARDLESFVVSVDKACDLIKKIPDKFIKLGFSGINSVNEVEKYKLAGARGVLVGTSLMKAKNISEYIKDLKGPSETMVKICATRSLEAASAAIDAGAEFLGLVFTPHIKTHTVDMKVAREIGKKMKGKIKLVGVFQNMPLRIVQKIIKDCNLDYAQFHGDESPEYIKNISIKVIKAFRLTGEFDVEKARSEMQKYRVDMYLVDRIKQSEGPMLNLEKVNVLAKEFLLAFAGGLNPENVAEVITKVKPKMVDVASGVETNGEQDLKKIKQFIMNAKGVLL